jgi:hypothetical protein
LLQSRQDEKGFDAGGMLAWKSSSRHLQAAKLHAKYCPKALHLTAAASPPMPHHMLPFDSLPIDIPVFRTVCNVFLALLALLSAISGRGFGSKAARWLVCLRSGLRIKVRLMFLLSSELRLIRIGSKFLVQPSCCGHTKVEILCTSPWDNSNSARHRAWWQKVALIAPDPATLSLSSLRVTDILVFPSATRATEKFDEFSLTKESRYSQISFHHYSDVVISHLSR